MAFSWSSSGLRGGPMCGPQLGDEEGRTNQGESLEERGLLDGAHGLPFGVEHLVAVDRHGDGGEEEHKGWGGEPVTCSARKALQILLCFGRKSFCWHSRLQ